MTADDETATLEGFITQLKKDKLSDLEWESLGYDVHGLLGPGQLFNVNPQYEKLGFMHKAPPYSDALKELASEIQNRNKEAALGHAELALKIWQLTSD